MYRAQAPLRTGSVHDVAFWLVVWASTFFSVWLVVKVFSRCFGLFDVPLDYFGAGNTPRRKGWASLVSWRMSDEDRARVKLIIRPSLRQQNRLHFLSGILFLNSENWLFIAREKNRFATKPSARLFLDTHTQTLSYTELFLDTGDIWCPRVSSHSFFIDCEHKVLSQHSYHRPLILKPASEHRHNERRSCPTRILALTTKQKFAASSLYI